MPPETALFEDNAIFAEGVALTASLRESVSAWPSMDKTKSREQTPSAYHCSSLVIFVPSLGTSRLFYN